MSKLFKRLFGLLFVVIVGLTLISCGNSQEDPEKDPENDVVDCEKNPEHEDCKDDVDPNPGDGEDQKPEASIKDNYPCISIAEALQKAQEAGEAGTAEKFYVYGTIKKVSNATYGEMTITDGTNDLYIYGVYSKDESTRYDAMADKPVAGDEVVLYGMLKTYKGNPEMDRGYLQEFKHAKVEVDDAEYKAVTIKEAREAQVGQKLQITGVVAQITYAFGMNPNGFYVVDNTGSIYVYGSDATAAVAEGNKVTIAGEKTYYVLEKEQSNAQKFGYKGSCQLQNAKVVSNDKGNNAYDKSWIEETTVKAILETPVSENITNKIYKVTAYVKKAPGNGFVNYYINDLDGETGTYVYTACNGDDFSWLDEFDGKICTVYVTAINAKATATSCFFRFLPIEVKNENFDFDTKDAANYALEYHAVGQFLNVYEADPAFEVLTSVSNELIGIKDVKLTYSSNNPDVAYFEEVDGKVIFHTKNTGKAVITINAENADSKASVTLEISVNAPQSFDALNVIGAINTADDTEVTVRGIVASSLVNQSGFYLIDETGTIAVVVNDASVLSTLTPGDEVVVKGIKDHKIKEDYTGKGQINIYNAEILVNYYGNHEYSTKTFITGKTIEELYKFDVNDDHSTEVYVVEAKIILVETAYFTSIKISGVQDESLQMTLYSSSANQYSFLKQYAGQTVTLELAMCNWNSKNYYAGCVISVTKDGVKTVNTLNFND
ncbi:MAG: OB-fold nucleic acid binding domain-containing protein [Bacilli bacterium]|nr:OB-fold nucleic acid binding domain-containing protein [Bacilli bacterium]